MSTVGFGDFRPYSDFERIICVVMFLAANGIFSLTLSRFGEILDDYDLLSAEIDFGADLIGFLAILEHFNCGFDVGH